jgi:hypothetical protein
MLADFYFNLELERGRSSQKHRIDCLRAAFIVPLSNGLRQTRNDGACFLPHSLSLASRPNRVLENASVRQEGHVRIGFHSYASFVDGMAFFTRACAAYIPTSRCA